MTLEEQLQKQIAERNEAELRQAHEEIRIVLEKYRMEIVGTPNGMRLNNSGMIVCDCQLVKLH
jgi:hypothetical protein